MEHEVYDPEYGDYKVCTCGHAYHFHFNPKTSWRWACVFSYNCDCKGFQQKVELVKAVPFSIVVTEKQVKDLLSDLYSMDDWQGGEPYRLFEKWLEDAGLVILKDVVLKVAIKT